MPVTPITYVYLILALASFVAMIIRFIKGDIEGGLTQFICLAFFSIGFSSNYQICPLWYCVGIDGM